MYLKRMELSGFKSFADRTELEFVPGVTAVVGPNGSGKSNISDSIRWVLGEQSAKNLRGSKMEDVIFAGSDSRRSVNFCEVSLTLDNSDGALPLDFQEVTITRRVYRSGDSEYLINRQVCRMKDIHELFMDTGLGKEAYSVIGQGRIEEILSTKSEDRRGIFEEAAGIVRYKSRKKEAEKRLEETETNLIRIYDLLHEIERNLGPLLKQKETADHYKLLKSELSQEEISLAVFTIEDLDVKCKALSKEMESVRDAVSLSQVGITTSEANLSLLGKACEDLDLQISKLQDLHLFASTEWEQKEGHKRVLLERISAASHLFEESTQAEQRLKEEESACKEELQQESTFIQELTASILELSVKIDEQQGNSGNAIQKARLQQSVEVAKSELIQLLNQSAALRNELRNQQGSAELLNRRLERFSQEELQLIDQVDLLQPQIQSTKIRIMEDQQALQSVQEKLDETLMQEKALQSEYERYHKADMRLQTDLASRQSRLDLLRDMQQEYGGYNIGVRAVLQAADKGHLKGVCGAVADLLQVPREYEVAIETALGAATQNIVVETEAAGREAILFLKRSGGGRSTFLPLDVIRPRNLAAEDRRKWTAHQGFIGVGDELVSTNDKYKFILSSLLGTVVVAKTIQDATEIARACSYRYRVVTLDGDVVNPGGSMTGGSQQKRSTSLLGRTREVADLEAECKTLSRDAQVARERIGSLQSELLEIQRKRHAHEEQIQRDRNSLSDQESNLREAQLALKAVTDKQMGLSFEMEQTYRELANVKDKIKQATIELMQSETQAQAFQESVERTERQLQVLQAEQEDHSEELTQYKVLLATKDQDLLSRKEQVLRIENKLRLLQLDQQKRQSDRAELTERLTAIRGELALCERELLQLDHNKGDLEGSLLANRRNRSHMQEEYSRKMGAVKSLRDQLRQKETELHQNEVLVARMDVELSSQLERLATEYQMSYEWAKSHYSLPVDPIVSRKSVQSLKLQIERLGEVNLGAIEEYERQQERFLFMSAQKQDLVEAKTKLYDVISELDEEMSKKFSDTFAEIRLHFIEVFSALFGGGRADLILADPTKPLTTGIDVVAQPPGKKLQNLSLLSGGERALAAIALLFAILRVKPVPFCVLDEVEAALDEANVSRFASYLRSFSNQTQFIAITHRRGTMEGADVLYGVTMEESGISKLVSVRLLDQAAATRSTG